MCLFFKQNKRRVIVWGKMENPRVTVNLNHIFIYLILTKLLSIFSSLTIYSILNTYNPHNSICVFNLTCFLQCLSNSSFVSPPTTENNLDPNPRLYDQAPRGIKYSEVQISLSAIPKKRFSP